MKKGLLLALMFASSLTVANAFDLDGLKPCKPAAARYCDRSGGMTTSNLLQCGATLAALSNRVGNECRQVLRRYGQLSATN
jgi:hypothetical protein